MQQCITDIWNQHSNIQEIEYVVNLLICYLGYSVPERIS